MCMHVVDKSLIKINSLYMAIYILRTMKIKEIPYIEYNYMKG